MSKKYSALREECCEANRVLSKSGLVDLTFGNVSVADRQQRVFAIKPSGVEYEALRPRDIVVVDFEGVVVEGKLRPSSDTPTHRRLLNAFEGVRAIVHTHSRNAVAFAQVGKSIPCLSTTHADYFYGEVPVTREMTEAEIASDYEWETGGVILETFQERNPLQVPAVLVNRHGPFAWGKSGIHAVEVARALEIVADLAWKAFVFNGPITPINSALLDKHFLRKHGPAAYYGQNTRN